MKDKAEIMRRLRKNRRDAGLVELRVWVTPDQRSKIEKYIKDVRAGWDDPSLWQGADAEPLLLDGAPDSSFDDKEWKFSGRASK